MFDAAQIADPEIDYNQFDSDKDGVVDFFMLVFVGCGGNGASQVQAAFCQYFGNTVPFYDNIWPHSSSLEPQFKDEATGLRGYISDDQLKSLTEVPQCWTSADRLQFADCAAADTAARAMTACRSMSGSGPYNVNPETVSSRPRSSATSTATTLACPTSTTRAARSTATSTSWPPTTAST